MRTAFVTGSTGFLGSHFLLNSFGNGYDEFILLVRGPNDAMRMKKVEIALTKASNSYATPFDVQAVLSKCTVVNGNLLSPECGVDKADLMRAVSGKQIDVWHSASLLLFEDEKQEELDALNIHGTTKLLELIKTTQCVSNFFYISTAFTCGSQEGLIQEELHTVGRAFSNIYERSKCITEHNVVNFCAQNNIPWTMIRPSVIIGNSQTKQTGGSDSGMYNFMRQLSGICKIIKNPEDSVRIYGNPNACTNWIPVDAVVGEMISIVNDGNYAGEIFHVTSYSSPSIGFVAEETSRQLDNKKVLISDFDQAHCSPLEKFAIDHTKIYASYFKDVRVFNNKRKFHNHVSSLDMMGYISEGIKAIKEETAHHIFSNNIITLNNSDQLSVHTAGKPENPAVLLINAHGMPIQLVSPLAKKLMSDYFVITWETRVPPSHDLSTTLRNASHIQDVIQILNHYNIPNTHVIGWCTGSGLALHLTKDQPTLVNKLILLNGSLKIKEQALNDVSYTAFEDQMIEVMPRVAHDAEFSNLMHSVFFNQNRDLNNLSEMELRDKADTILTAVDPSIMHLTNKPFETPESLRYHARLLDGHINDFPNNISDIQHEALVLTGERDFTSCKETSIETHKLLRNSQFHLFPGDHFMLYNSSEYMDSVFNFLQKQSLGNVINS